MYGRSPLSLDYTGHSRKDLGVGIYGEEYVLRHGHLEAGSKALLKALWKHHPGALAYARLNGREVVRP